METGRILRLRGLPWSAGEEDVRSFFDGFAPADVYVRRRGEKSTGEAFVEFETSEQAASAQAERNHKDLGQRYIEIFPTDAESMESVKGTTEEAETGWVVRLRGLPFSATAENVVEFFEGLEVVGGEEGVVFTWGRDGRPLGEAYVEFHSEEAQQEALARDRERMGTRYIEIFKATKADLAARAGAARSREGVGYGRGARGRESQTGSEPDFGPSVGPHAHAAGQPTDGSALRLRGLPYSATVQDIVEFFAEFDVKAEDVHIVMRPARNGQLQGTGIAYVQFASPAAAEAARAERHRKNIGSRYIECLSMWPPASPGMPPPPLPGPMPLPPAHQGPFGPRGMPPMGPMVPPPVSTRPPMPGAFQHDVQAPGPRPAGPSGRVGYPGQGGPPAMVPIGIPAGQAFGPPPVRPGMQPLRGAPQPQQPPVGRPGQKGGYRGGRPGSPGPQMSMQQGMGAAASQQMSPAGYQQQQQLLMQQQFLMHQHLMHQHQQAMSHMRHPGWGMQGPIGGPFVAPFAPAIGPPRQQQRPPPQQRAPIAAGRPQLAPSVQQPPVDESTAIHGAGAAPDASPTSSLQSELQSLTLGPRTHSSASRAPSGAVPPPQSPALHGTSPRSQPGSHDGGAL